MGKEHQMTRNRPQPMLLNDALGSGLDSKQRQTTLILAAQDPGLG